jgi:hypothetical protein
VIPTDRVAISDEELEVAGGQSYGEIALGPLWP